MSSYTEMQTVSAIMRHSGPEVAIQSYIAGGCGLAVGVAGQFPFLVNLQDYSSSHCSHCTLVKTVPANYSNAKTASNSPDSNVWRRKH